jgi:hypothetical protein
MRSGGVTRAPALLVCLVGALLLISFGFAGRPLWLDEEMIALNVRDRSLGELAGPLWLNQAAPLGWLWLVRASVVVFGTGERALHLVPVLFGIGTLVTAWWVGRRWLTPAGAAALAVLCAFGDFLWYFATQLKHYSADACGAFVVAAAAAWAIDAPAADAARGVRRIDRWWIVAALAAWCSFGALLATPAIAIVVAIMTARRAGWTGAWRGMRFGIVWVAMVALHSALTIRYATRSDYLNSYWASAFPPDSAGIVDTLRWLAGRLEPLAINPGGTPLWALFWLIAAAGLVAAIVRAPAIGLTLATVPLSAFVLAAFRVVPMSDRLSLWMVPSFYFGIASAVDAGVLLWRRAATRRSLAGIAASIAALLPASWLCVSVVRTSTHDMATLPRVPQGVDDRAAVEWLMSLRGRGDSLMAMPLTMPAVWWYGRVPLSTSGASLPDDGRLFEVSDASAAGDCSLDSLRAALEGNAGVAVYVGFDQNEAFTALLLERLSELGVVTSYRRFETGHAAVVDLRLPPAGHFIVPGTRPAGGEARPRGCVAIRRAARW